MDPPIAQVGCSRARRSTSSRNAAATGGRLSRWSRSSGAGPGPGASAAPWPAPPTSPATPGGGSSRTSPASTARSAQSTRGRASWRRSTPPRGGAPAARRPWPRTAPAGPASQQLAEGPTEQSQGHAPIVPAVRTRSELAAQDYDRLSGTHMFTPGSLEPAPTDYDAQETNQFRWEAQVGVPSAFALPSRAGGAGGRQSFLEHGRELPAAAAAGTVG